MAGLSAGRRRRPWFRVRVGAVLVAVAVLGLLFARWSDRPRRQRKAAEAARHAQGYAAFDDDFRDLAEIAASTPAKRKMPVPAKQATPPHRPFAGVRLEAPGWLSGWLKGQLGQEVTSDLTVVNLDGSPVTDADLAWLEGLSRLRRIYLNGTAITDAGLAHLSGLAQLEVVELRETRLTGAGLAHLGHLTGLRELYLSDTPIGDASLTPLARLTALRELHLNHTAIRGPGLAALARLSNLRVLTLRGTAIDDDALANLRGLKALRLLDLDDTPITDAGLAHLEGLGELQLLYLNGTRVSDAGLERLRRALPQVRIMRSTAMQSKDLGPECLQGQGPGSQVPLAACPAVRLPREPRQRWASREGPRGQRQHDI